MEEFFDIDEADRAEAITVFDGLLKEENLGRKCRAYYPNTETTCPNCIINPRSGESTNRYKPGGPVEFIDGETCPVCEGTGRVSGTGLYDDLTMTIDWSPKPWANFGSNVVNIPDGAVVTRGFSVDLNKVTRCEYVILDVDNKYIYNKYKLLKEPYVLGAMTGNRYFIATWEKI